MTESIPANIRKSQEEIFIELALPAYDKNEISVKLEAQTLTVTTEPKEEQMAYNRQEFRKMRLKRTFRIPENIQTENIGARFENGILTLTLGVKKPAQHEINIL